MRSAFHLPLVSPVHLSPSLLSYGTQLTVLAPCWSISNTVPIGCCPTTQLSVTLYFKPGAPLLSMSVFSLCFDKFVLSHPIWGTSPLCPPQHTLITTRPPFPSCHHIPHCTSIPQSTAGVSLQVKLGRHVTCTGLVRGISPAVSTQSGYSASGKLSPTNSPTSQLEFLAPVFLSSPPQSLVHARQMLHDELHPQHLI